MLPSDIEATRRKIAAACPDVVFEYGDYHRALYGYKVDADGKTIETSIRTIIRPERPADPETNFDGQSEIIADVDSLIKLWRA